MRKQLIVAAFALTLSMSGESLFPIAVCAQQAMGASNVSAVTLQTMPGQNGQQMVVTPRGLVVPLPGDGVNSNQVQIYMGSQGGYWYVDKNNQNVDLTQAVQRLQARISQSSYQNAPQVPQYAPSPYYQEQQAQQPVTVNNYENQSSGSSGGSGAGTAAVAGLGAMAGAALGSAMWGGVPYGTPYYYGSGGHPYYYGSNGKPVYVNNSSHTANVSGNTVGNTNTANVAHVNQMQNQQKWYDNQRQQNPDQYKQWQNQRSNGSNPFVHQQANFGNNNVAQDRNGNFNNQAQQRGADAGRNAGAAGQNAGRNFSGGQQQRQAFGGGRAAGGRSGGFGGRRR